ncbi:hypothetical protein, partial [Elstera sp.]|uniref:hypothetical protein n=1 Tax=Elstera sp. TaxID=1916664 RepID=UPI0037BF27A4
MSKLLTGTSRLILGTALFVLGGCGAGANDGGAASGFGIISQVKSAGLFGTSADEKARADGQDGRVPVRDMEEVLTFVYKSVSGNYIDRTSMRPLV